MPPRQPPSARAKYAAKWALAQKQARDMLDAHPPSVTPAGLDILREQFEYPNGRDGNQLAKPMSGDVNDVLELERLGLAIRCKGGYYATDLGMAVAELSLKRAPIHKTPTGERP
jgi:hypothetical protein